MEEHTYSGPEDEKVKNENEATTGAENAEPDENQENKAPEERSWEEKYNEIYDTYLRLFSEFDNFRKRNAREKIELSKTAGAEIMSAMIPVVDDFDRALKSLAETSDLDALKSGVDLIFAKLKNTLAEKGLSEVNPIGETFDAEVHEAITNVPAPSADLKGKVMDVVEKGYKLNDKLIRFPKVVIYS